MALEVMWLLALVEVGVELLRGSNFEGFLEIDLGGSCVVS